MEILLTKTGAAEDVMSCKREDGSVTWVHVSGFFLFHDLCHYTIETTLSLKKAFLGMVAGGIDITEFELPKDQRNIELTPEALFAEHLVNLLLIDYTQGRMDNLIEIFRETYSDPGAELLSIVNEENLEEIRKRYTALMQQWKELPERETLKLIFEE